jgi:hypothetical protein
MLMEDLCFQTKNHTVARSKELIAKYPSGPVPAAFGCRGKMIDRVLEKRETPLSRRQTEQGMDYFVQIQSVLPFEERRPFCLYNERTVVVNKAQMPVDDESKDDMTPEPSQRKELERRRCALYPIGGKVWNKVGSEPLDGLLGLQVICLALRGGAQWVRDT